MRHPILLSLLSLCSVVAVPEMSLSQQLELPKDIKEEAVKDFDRGVNAAIIFSSQSALASGAFVFDGPDDNETDLSIFSLPFMHTWGEEGDRVRLVTEGALGNARFTRSIPVAVVPGYTVDGTSDFSRAIIWSGSLGAGVEVDLGQGFSIRPVMSLAYTHVRREFDYNNELTQLLREVFDIDRNFLNTSSDVLTYAPSLTATYKHDFEDASLKASVRYLHLWNEQLWSKSEELDVDSDSGLLQTKVQAEIPLGVSLFEMPLGLHPFAVRTDLNGAAREALPFSSFHEIGIDLTFSPQAHLPFVRQIRFGTSYTFADDFDGYRVGLGAEF